MLINFAETKYEPIPEGVYNLMITQVEEREGIVAPYLNITFAVTDEGDYIGRFVYDNLSLSERALRRLKSFLIACGYKVPQGEFNLDLGDLLNRELKAKVTIDTYINKDGVQATKNKIEAYLPK